MLRKAGSATLSATVPACITVQPSRFPQGGKPARGLGERRVSRLYTPGARALAAAARPYCTSSHSGRSRMAGRLLTAALGIAVAATACARAAPEEALRTQMGALQQSIEKRDAAAIGDTLAEDFIGNDGLDRRDAQRMAAGLFLRYRSVGAAFGPLQVRMHGDTRATVTFTVAATGGSGGMLPSEAQVYDVSTGWRDSGDGWRMTSARWSPRL